LFSSILSCKEVISLPSLSFQHRQSQQLLKK
jgi:hypothetical protein